MIGGNGSAALGGTATGELADEEIVTEALKSCGARVTPHVPDELKPLGYSLGEGWWGRGEEGMRKGIPAANHAPPVFRMRSTGLVQVVGGVGKSES